MHYLINLCNDNTSTLSMLTLMMKNCPNQTMDKTLTKFTPIRLFSIKMSQVKRKVTLHRFMSSIANSIHLFTYLHLLHISLPLSHYIIDRLWFLFNLLHLKPILLSRSLSFSLSLSSLFSFFLLDIYLIKNLSLNCT